MTASFPRSVLPKLLVSVATRSRARVLQESSLHILPPARFSRWSSPGRDSCARLARARLLPRVALGDGGGLSGVHLDYVSVWTDYSLQEGLHGHRL